MLPKNPSAGATSSSAGAGASTTTASFSFLRMMRKFFALPISSMYTLAPET